MKKLILIVLLGLINLYSGNKLTHSIKYLFAIKKNGLNKNHLLYIATFRYLKKQFLYDAEFAHQYYFNQNIHLRAKYDTRMTPEEIIKNHTEMEHLLIEHFINSKKNNTAFYSRIKKILGNNNKHIEEIDTFIEQNKNKYNK